MRATIRGGKVSRVSFVRVRRARTTSVPRARSTVSIIVITIIIIICILEDVYFICIRIYNTYAYYIRPCPHAYNIDNITFYTHNIVYVHIYLYTHSRKCRRHSRLIGIFHSVVFVNNNNTIHII